MEWRKLKRLPPLPLRLPSTQRQKKKKRVRELRYRIHIKIGEQVQTFSTNQYNRQEGRIYFTDKFGQPKEFSDTPEVVIGIEDKQPILKKYRQQEEEE